MLVDRVTGVAPFDPEKLNNILVSSRGFLANYPDDVVALVNGQPVTKGDLLAVKRKKQGQRLAVKRMLTEPVRKPCFVEVFYLGDFPFMGWHVYVVTLLQHWQLSFRIDNRRHFGPDLKDEQRLLECMRLFPCGYLPMIENIQLWMPEFVRQYRRPSRSKHGWPRGRALARAVIKGNDLVGVEPWLN